jgi:hypothetical protein
MLLAGGVLNVRGEAMLQLFNVSWKELAQKMPEIAEAGYTSLWLPPPAKAGSVYSVGYDLFDPFDLGDKNQRGTVATHYGTKAELLEMVRVAHRFGIRVYFDNIMNHRGYDIPGANASTPTNVYPGLAPQDFHLKKGSDGYYSNWPSVESYSSQWDVQYEPLAGLLDLATEPGSVNGNFGSTLGSTTPKLTFVRQPSNPEYYMNPNAPRIAGNWYPFDGSNGVPVAEDVNSYLIRAAMWTLDATKCDGFRLDAVKHVPSGFFGDSYPTWNGYNGAIQAMFDWVHGYGTNVTGNGYLESDDSRNSCFDTEAPRNDAMLFGEHLGNPPSFTEYITSGMRLFNIALRTQLDSAFQGYGSLSGLDQRDYAPYSGAMLPTQGVQFAQDHDHSFCCVSHRDLHDAFNFMHEGLPMIYSDGYNFAGSPSDSSTFPNVPYANYLGEFFDNAMPELAYLHNQLARGGTRPRWSDNNIVAFERYDYRDVDASTAYTNANAGVVLFVLNDNTSYPGDILFDDGVSRTSDGYYTCANGSPSRGVGLVVGFPPGSVLTQMASSAVGSGRVCTRLLVHEATQSLADATNTANAVQAWSRKIYVGGQTLAPGGGAVELVAPSAGWVAYAYQWPEPSRANVLTNAIAFRQGGVAAPSALVYRHDGTNGDGSFNPIYPFKMRGSVKPDGTVVGGQNVSNQTYAIDIPVVTNANLDVQVRCDASAGNVLVKLDGGVDLNSQMGLGATNASDLRDNRPGYATDVYLGYEQALLQFRYGPEKFAARLIARNNVTSDGAETYYYNVGGANLVVNGSGNGSSYSAQTASWAYHDPMGTVTVLTNASLPVAPANQMAPTNPAAGQAVDIWVKVGYQFQIDTCYLYYTTDGSNPEGAYGVGKGTTKVQPAYWANRDASDATIDWWKGTIPASAQTAGAQVRYKVALFLKSASAIADGDDSKLYGLTQFGITNFNPVAAKVWLHNDLNTNSTATGLATGYHIVRARCFLPRSGKSAVYNTFLQTFYYDGQLPSGVIAYPATNATLSGASYEVVVRADSSVTGVDFNIQDSDSSNDDAVTGQMNGNGSTNGSPVFVAARQVAANSAISQQYTNYPNEFRFTYQQIPSSGTAAIVVRLKTLGTGVYPNRFTALTNLVTTAAPANVLYLSNPSADGQMLVLESNASVLLQGCFTPTLTTNTSSLFSLYINGALQPRTGYIFRAPNAVPGCSGLRSFLCYWTGFQPGTNVIELDFTNTVVLQAKRTVYVAINGSSLDSDGDGVPDWMEMKAGTNPYDPGSVLRITSFAPVNSMLEWPSVANINYRVLATTNLGNPMSSVSGTLTGTGLPILWPDPAPDPMRKFYRIQVVP